MIILQYALYDNKEIFRLNSNFSSVQLHNKLHKYGAVNCNINKGCEY